MSDLAMRVLAVFENGPRDDPQGAAEAAIGEVLAALWNPSTAMLDVVCRTEGIGTKITPEHREHVLERLRLIEVGSRDGFRFDLRRALRVFARENGLALTPQTAQDARSAAAGTSVEPKP